MEAKVIKKITSHTKNTAEKPKNLFFQSGSANSIYLLVELRAGIVPT